MVQKRLVAQTAVPKWQCQNVLVQILMGFDVAIFSKNMSIYAVFHSFSKTEKNSKEKKMLS